MCFIAVDQAATIACETDARGVVATALTYGSRGRSPSLDTDERSGRSAARGRPAGGAPGRRAGSVGAVGAVQRDGQPGSEACDETPTERQEVAEHPGAGLESATGGAREALQPAESDAGRSAGEPGTGGRPGPDAAPAAPGSAAAPGMLATGSPAASQTGSAAPHPARDGAAGVPLPPRSGRTAPRSVRRGTARPRLGRPPHRSNHRPETLRSSRLQLMPLRLRRAGTRRSPARRPTGLGRRRTRLGRRRTRLGRRRTGLARRRTRLGRRRMPPARRRTRRGRTRRRTRQGHTPPRQPHRRPCRRVACGRRGPRRHPPAPTAGGWARTWSRRRCSCSRPC